MFDELVKRLELNLGLLKYDRGVVPEAIVVTVHFAEWGRRREFEDVRDLLGRLSANLGIPREHSAVVPRNHDINWKSCERYFTAYEGDDLKPERPYWPKWQQYVGFFGKFYREVSGVTFTEKRPWILGELPEPRMVVAGLNSTMVETNPPSWFVCTEVVGAAPGFPGWGDAAPRGVSVGRIRLERLV